MVDKDPSFRVRLNTFVKVLSDSKINILANFADLIRGPIQNLWFIMLKLEYIKFNSGFEWVYLIFNKWINSNFKHNMNLSLTLTYMMMNPMQTFSLVQDNKNTAMAVQLMSLAPTLINLNNLNNQNHLMLMNTYTI